MTPLHVTEPTVVPAVGEKVIRELVGNASTGTGMMSVARMTSPPGWEEPAQAPEFDEVTVVLQGAVVVEHEGGSITVRPGEAVLARAGERVRYSTPDGAEYVRSACRRLHPTRFTETNRRNRGTGRSITMCRNIRTLYNFEPPTTREEIDAAAVQYVRKVSGMQKPSLANAEAFERAIDEVAAATSRLLESLVTSAAPRDREVEAERRRARAAVRFGTTG